MDPPDGKCHTSRALAQGESRSIDPNLICFSPACHAPYVPTVFQILQAPEISSCSRAGPRLSHHSDRRALASRRQAETLERGPTRPLGGTSSSRRHQPERKAVVRSGGEFLLGRRTHGRALHTHRHEHDPLRSPIEDPNVHAPLEDCFSAQALQQWLDEFLEEPVTRRGRDISRSLVTNTLGPPPSAR